MPGLGMLKAILMAMLPSRLGSTQTGALDSMEPRQMVLQRLQAAVPCLSLCTGLLSTAASLPWGRPCGLASWGWGWTNLGKLLNFHVLEPSQRPHSYLYRQMGCLLRWDQRPYSTGNFREKKIKRNAPSPRLLSLGLGLHSPIIPHLPSFWV